jgi:hypothetical protein
VLRRLFIRASNAADINCDEFGRPTLRELNDVRPGRKASWIAGALASKRHQRAALTNRMEEYRLAVTSTVNNWAFDNRADFARAR